MGVPVGTPLITPGVALANKLVASCADDVVGDAPQSAASAPTTWGVAIEVPDRIAVAVSEVYQAEVMLCPGA